MNYTYCTNVRDTYEGEENALAEALATVEENLTDLDKPVTTEGQCVISTMTNVRVPFEGTLTIEHAVETVNEFEKVMARHGFDISYRNSWIDAGCLHFVVQYEPASEKETLELQVERLASFIMREVPGEPSASEGAVDCSIRVIKELQAAAHALWGMLATIGEACDRQAPIELIEAVSESRNLYYVGGNDGLHRVTDRGVIPDVEPNRGSHAIARNVKAAELVSNVPTKADRIQELGLRIAETVSKDSGIVKATIEEVTAALCDRMEKLGVEEGDLVILRYSEDGWIPTQPEVDSFARSIQEVSGKSVQFLVLPVGYDLERLDVETAVRLLIDRAVESRTIGIQEKE